MAKIYYRKYKDEVDNGTLTVEEVLEKIPERWREEVHLLFKGEN